ncbi:MAG: hypothetical protein Q9222_007557 [Ikaeria aurantiellina]
MAQSHEGTNGVSDLSSRIEKCSADLKALSAAARQDQKAQKQLLGVCREATGMLEPPPETVFRYIMMATVFGVLRSAVFLGMIDTINANEKPQTAASIGKAVGVDPAMAARVLRPLAALHIIIETGPATYTSTPVSKALGIPFFKAGLLWTTGPSALAFVKLADWLKEHGSTNADSASIGPWQYANNSDLSFFDWLQEHPADHKIFDDFMAGQRANRTEWFDTFPAQSILLDGASSNTSSPLLIDIGGGIGEELSLFAKKYPSSSGRLILQDLPSTIANAKPSLPSSITPMPYDFFTPQPVKGARAYYFRFVFHDWSDAKCVQILKNTASAMEKGYSKVLIHEWVLPDVGAPLQGSLMDLNMMCIPGGMERTESQWRGVLDEAGLKIEKIWVESPEMESLIEAVLKE